jgi:GNAT superfamily N-acetyltransferase
VQEKKGSQSVARGPAQLEPLPGVSFHVARPGQSSGVRQFQEEVYLREFGHVPHDDFDRTAHILCAADSADRYVAALRVVLPEERPFDLEESVDLEALLGRGCRPALLGRLCVRRDYRMASTSIRLHAYLMSFTYAFARARGVTDLLLYTYKSLETYYRGLFFNRLDVQFVHPIWGSVCLMGINIEAFRLRYQDSPNSIARIILDSAPTAPQ